MFSRRILLGLGVIASLLGCWTFGDSEASIDTREQQPSTMNLVATTGHIADALRHITKGTGAEIKLLCGPGIDPHSYAASPCLLYTSDAADE